MVMQWFLCLILIIVGVKMSLYTIDPNFLELLQKEEYTEEDLIQIDKLSNDERHKIVTLAGYIQNIRSELQAVTQAIKDMKKRENRLIKKIDGLCEIIIAKMNLLRAEKISDSPHYEVFCYTNPPSVCVYDENKLPPDYLKRTEEYTIDKSLIKSDIIKGITVPGACLAQDKRIVIK